MSDRPWSAIESIFAVFAMSFEVPWLVRLDGNHVLPCARAALLFKFEVMPKLAKQDESAWSADILGPILERHPSSKAAMMESAVAIWRLKNVEVEDGEDSSWVENMLAWLVSRSIESLHGAEADRLIFSSTDTMTLRARLGSLRCEWSQNTWNSW